MKRACIALLTAFAGAILFSGCETTQPSGLSAKSAVSPIPYRYAATDGRTIEIGRSKPDRGGWIFNDPHLDKPWIAEGFAFNGYDALYILPVTSIAKVHDDERPNEDFAMSTLRAELVRSLSAKGIFPRIETPALNSTPASNTLTLEITILEYSKGSTTARFFAGLMGAGQPLLHLRGTMMNETKKVFEFEAVRNGVSAETRMLVVSDEEAQIGDIRSFVLDFTDFIAAIAGKYQPKN